MKILRKVLFLILIYSILFTRSFYHSPHVIASDDEIANRLEQVWMELGGIDYELSEIAKFLDERDYVTATNELQDIIEDVLTITDSVCVIFDAIENLGYDTNIEQMLVDVIMNLEILDSQLWELDELIQNSSEEAAIELEDIIEDVLDIEWIVGYLFENILSIAPDETETDLVSEYHEKLVEVTGTNSNLALRRTPDLDGVIIKRVPDAWVLKIINTHENTVLEDGYIWWEVKDPSLGIIGWVASDYLSMTNQDNLIYRSELLNEETQRIEATLMALTHYYNNQNNESSLYSSDDNGNTLSKLNMDDFPLELVLAMILDESGDFNFDNVVYSVDEEGNYMDGGVGIMQIIGINRGWGSRLSDYLDEYNMADDSKSYSYPGGSRYRHYYYGNTRQGIYANIKDGLRVIQWAYGKSLDAKTDYPFLGAVWRYNIGGNWKKTSAHSYLNGVLNKLSRLPEYYGDDYRGNLESYGYDPLSEDELDELIDNLGSYIMLSLHSPGELRVYDSENRVTGLVEGNVLIEIPNSDYHEGNLIIYSPSDPLSYEIQGTDEGPYSLTVTSVNDNAVISFNATAIDISDDQLHQYSIDWDVLQGGGKGVSLQIDDDNDGTYDLRVNSDYTLNAIEVEEESVREPEPDPSPSPTPSPSPEPTPEPTPEPEQGGIPGFPTLAIVIGVLLSLFILKKIQG